MRPGPGVTDTLGCKAVVVGGGGVDLDGDGSQQGVARWCSKVCFCCCCCVFLTTVFYCGEKRSLKKFYTAK